MFEYRLGYQGGGCFGESVKRDQRAYERALIARLRLELDQELNEAARRLPQQKLPVRDGFKPRPRPRRVVLQARAGAGRAITNLEVRQRLGLEPTDLRALLSTKFRVR